MNTRRLTTLLALLAALTAACKSAPKEKRTDPLPFHVAVIPLETPIVREANAKADDATDMQLTPDLARLSRAISQSLSHGAFTQVSLLSRDDVDRKGELTSQERSARWLAAARKAGADLVLECELELTPTIHQAANGNFWLDFPLFLVGGPFVWFVKDRTYSADVELRGSFYDLGAIDGEEVPLGSPLARVLSAGDSFGDVDLNFFQRKGNVGHYAASILIPSGFLAHENDDLEKDLDKVVIERLSKDFAASVVKKRDELARSDLVAPFHFDPDDTHVVLEPDGGYRLKGTVLLRDGGVVERMAGYRIRIAGKEIEREFGDAEPGLRGGRWIVYRIDERIDAAAGTKTFALELEARARDRFVRTYTFALPGV